MDLEPNSETTATAALDIGSIAAADYPHRDLPNVTGERLSRFQAIVRRSVLNEIHQHGQSTMDVEICGVLLGNVYREPGGPYLYIEASIRGEHAGNQNAQVTFTAETWTHIQKVMEEQHPEKKVLGWYHTHPGFGIFLSGMDLFIQDNFFNEPWQVALVYDPKNAEEGLFVWKSGKPSRDDFLVEEDVANDQPEVKFADVKTGGDELAQSRTINDLNNRLQSLERRMRWFVALIGGLIMLALVWPLVLFLVLPLKAPDPATTRPSQFRSIDERHGDAR